MYLFLHCCLHICAASQWNLSASWRALLLLSRSLVCTEREKEHISFQFWPYALYNSNRTHFPRRRTAESATQKPCMLLCTEIESNLGGAARRNGSFTRWQRISWLCSALWADRHRRSFTQLSTFNQMCRNIICLCIGPQHDALWYQATVSRRKLKWKEKRKALPAHGHTDTLTTKSPNTTRQTQSTQPTQQETVTVALGDDTLNRFLVTWVRALLFVYICEQPPESRHTDRRADLLHRQCFCAIVLSEELKSWPIRVQ